jgi:hypothetical protein
MALEILNVGWKGTAKMSKVGELKNGEVRPGVSLYSHSFTKGLVLSVEVETI